MHPTTRLSVRLGAVITAVVAMFATVLWAMPAAAAAPGGHAFPVSDGYVLLGGDGGIFPFDVPMAGAAASDPTRCPDNVTDRTEPNGTCWSVALTPSGLGYWILNGDTGAIYPYGTAGFYGQPATKFAGVGREFVPNMLQIVPTPSAKGYWVYESGLSGLGTVDHFGDAGFFGDTTTLVQKTGGSGFNGRPVGMAATADGKGYWEVRSDGGVFAFGDAKFYGSMGGRHLAQAVIGITATADGKGYWLYAADGGVFSFGDARFGGSLGALTLQAPIVGMARNPAGPGYWLAAADGGVFTFGGAPFFGSIYQFVVHPHRPIFAIAARRTAVG
jgi:hypothetical protein